ncbi:phosphatidylinositol glycan, class V [Strigomonas culicis]|uniref:GPI mannosyltransferase 2 n=1 Tax=Strigomonas culicis TaxID=28005 RepID=S9U8V7_9TRYP|nr:phosphatidylinositol glycan, class V [Strigomonas culicis]|eukprot:EPY27172.1 phosphatidylinositol glycan, class V [Strigomonas culicis]
MLDALPCVPADAAAPPGTAHAQLYGRLRIVGGVVFTFLFTPAMIFSVVVYTETLFFFLLLVGIYLLADYPSPFAPLPSPPLATGGAPHTLSRAQQRMLRCPLPRRGEAAATDEEAEEAAVEGPACHTRAHAPLQVQWRQQLCTRRELAAWLAFFVAGLSRSNAFFSGGFILYPLFLQLCFPALYQRRCALVNAAAYQQARRQRPGCVTVSARYVPSRYPHPLRVLVLLLATASLTLPYLAMSYVAHARFIAGADGAAGGVGPNGAIRPAHFHQFYAYIQRKYWNVGFLRAYTVTNAPNVLIAVPLMICLARFGYGYGRALLRRGAVLESCVYSSNLVYMALLTVIGFLLAHIQVSTRLLSGVPAFYLAIGTQLAQRSDGSMTRLILAYLIVWNILGAVLFPNFLPWT